MDKLSELDFLIGGVGFVSGLLLASIFGGDKGGCGCGPKVSMPQMLNAPTADPLANAKTIGPGVAQPAQTMGRLGMGRATTMGSLEPPGNDLCAGATSRCVRCRRDFNGQCYCWSTGKCDNFWDYL